MEQQVEVENGNQQPAESESQQIPPTTTPPAPVTNILDDPYVKSLENTLRANNQRLQQLEDRLANPPAPAPAPQTDEEARAQMFENPRQFFRGLLQEELQQTIAPLQEFVSNFQGQSQTDKLITQFKDDPRFKGSWDSNIESYVREQAAQIPPKHLNENSFGILVVSAIGMKHTGMFPNSQPAPVPAPTPTPEPVKNLPLHMRPSAPPAPTTQKPAPTFKPLEENERRLLRERNARLPKDRQMTEEDYRKWENLPASEVAFTDLNKPTSGDK